MKENDIGTAVLDAAIEIHRELGPGLLETVYEIVLARVLEDSGLSVERQVPVSIEYKGIQFKEGFRADMIVENKVILHAAILPPRLCASAGEWFPEFIASEE